MSLGVETQRGSRCEAPASFGTNDDDMVIVRSAARTNRPTHRVRCHNSCK